MDVVRTTLTDTIVTVNGGFRHHRISVEMREAAEAPERSVAGGENEKRRGEETRRRPLRERESDYSTVSA